MAASSCDAGHPVLSFSALPRGAGVLSASRIAAPHLPRYGLSTGLVTRHYLLEGGMAYATATRARALADLLTGDSLRAVARKHGIALSTLREWRDQALQQGYLPGLDPARKSARGAVMETSSLEELVGAYARSTLNAIRVQADLLGDREWLERQPPEFVLAVHRDLTERAARLLAPAARVEGAAPPLALAAPRGDEPKPEPA